MRHQHIGVKFVVRIIPTAIANNSIENTTRAHVFEGHSPSSSFHHHPTAGRFDVSKHLHTLTYKNKVLLRSKSNLRNCFTHIMANSTAQTACIYKHYITQHRMATVKQRCTIQSFIIIVDTLKNGACRKND